MPLGARRGRRRGAGDGTSPAAESIACDRSARDRRRSRGRWPAAAGPRARDPPAPRARGARSASRPFQAGCVAHQSHRLFTPPGRRPVGELERQHAAAAGRHLPAPARIRVIRQAQGSAQRGRPGVPPAASPARPPSPPAAAAARAACAGRATGARRDRARAPRPVAPHPHEALAQLPVARRHDARQHVGMTAGTWSRSARRGRHRGRAGAAGAGSRTCCRSTGAAARVRGVSSRGDVGHCERRIGGRLDDGERRAVAGAAEAVGVAQLVPPHLHAEARQDLRRSNSTS